MLKKFLMVEKNHKKLKTMNLEAFSENLLYLKMNQEPLQLLQIVIVDV